MIMTKKQKRIAKKLLTAIDVQKDGEASYRAISCYSDFMEECRRQDMANGDTDGVLRVYSGVQPASPDVTALYADELNKYADEVNKAAMRFCLSLCVVTKC